MAPQAGHGDGTGSTPGPGAVPPPSGGVPSLSGFALGGHWDACAASAALAAAAEAASGPGWRCDGLTRDEMTGLLRRWQALESWAAAGKLGVLRALIRDEDQPLPGGSYRGDLPEGWTKSLTHEVAAALAVSVTSAENLMWLAWDLQAKLPAIGELLALGELTLAKARAVDQALSPLTDEDAATAEAMIVPELPGKTYSQIAGLAAQAAITVDPESAARRREEAERTRSRVLMFREESGAAGLSGRDLPTDQALAAHARVCERAAQYQDSGAFGAARMDQLRATAYLDLINGTTAQARIAAGHLATGSEPGTTASDGHRTAHAAPASSGPSPAGGEGGTVNDDPDTASCEGSTGSRDPGTTSGERATASSEGGTGSRDPDTASGESATASGESATASGEGGTGSGEGGTGSGEGGTGSGAPGNAGGIRAGTAASRDADGPSDGDPDNSGSTDPGTAGSGDPDRPGSGDLGRGPASDEPVGDDQRDDAAGGGPSGGGPPGGSPPAGSPPAAGTARATAKGATAATKPSPPRLTDLMLPLATLLGLAERPGEGHGLGPLDPGLCRDLAAAAITSPWTRLCVTVTNDEGIAIGHGCARPGRRRKSPPDAGIAGTGRAAGLGLPARVQLTITESRLKHLARGAENLAERAENPARMTGPRGTSAWQLSRDDQPGPSGRAGTPGSAGPPGGFGTWTLTLPDGRRLAVALEPMPTFDCDHRHEARAYQPGDTLRHLVQVRDGECTFPPCSRHARETDFEHAMPYDKGGRTCACNAGSRSRQCHRVKQSPGWNVTQPKPGWHEWTTPAGRSYTQGPKRYPV